MSSDTSDTRWLHQLKAGDRHAAQVIWERYFRLLVARARQHLGGTPRQAADEEDVALSAFGSFCRGVEAGRFPRLDDRNDLRFLLLLLVARKARRQVERNWPANAAAARCGSRPTCGPKIRTRMCWPR